MTAQHDPTLPDEEHAPLLCEGDRVQNHGAILDAYGSGEVDNAEEGGLASPDLKEPSTLKLIVIMGSIWVGVFLGALDATVIATLSAPISTSFHSFTLVSWLASSYLISNAALQPLSGRLTDIFGRRSGLIFSNVFFGAGNLICGLASSEAAMIFGRVIAGMGGGGLFAISTFVASDLIPLRQRGLWQGFGNVCYGLGAGLGGVFGGWINDRWGWRWAFLIQVPCVAVSGVLVAFTVNIPVKENNLSRIRRVDFLGAMTLVVSLTLLLLGLNSGGNIVPWTHPLVLTALPLSLVFLVAFIFVEDRVPEPIIPTRLLTRRAVWAPCVVNWLQTMAVFAVVFYIPIYFQIRGLSATQSGARMIPQALGAAIGSLGSGLIMRATGRYYYLNLVTQALFLAGFALIAITFDQDTPDAPPYIYILMVGIGYGGMLTITLLALISAEDHKHHSVITSASYAFRSTGSTLGIAIASGVFQNLLKSGLWKRFGDRENAGEIIGRVRDSIDEIRHLPPGWQKGVLEVYMASFKGVWWTMFGLAVLSALCSLLMKEHVLHNTLARD
ncbi:MFS multidrug transporter [Eremomyces bilateralis CBS 781.70]|uniref:MFS multidrug transporter n=1 Tax=Eremomyces bilateralis CBS 781.70 TaxID=1392243 RepID=A0A6G1FUD9_9PEZI|nr:MFS multidrug transporter [Eremomyces bilateralis CBS 781.70]KAF1809318.1 MFS multidrug transporter [Eremomyces bilateralis CBS 781.70]